MIIGISGKKQSGKSTLGEFIVLNKILGNVSYQKFDMADPLKSFLVDRMNINHRLIYGSDEDKNGFTQYKWTDMPHYISLALDWSHDKTYPKNEYLTGREMMEQFGTNICRRMYPTIWVDAAVKDIIDSKSDVKYSCDVRFPDEVVKLQNVGGIIVRLTAGLQTTHISNTALDYFDNFDIIIDNTDMDINEKNAALMYGLSQLDLIQLDEDNFLFSQYFNDGIKQKVIINDSKS